MKKIFIWTLLSFINAIAFGNEKPYFTSLPVTYAYENEEYIYEITFKDIDLEDTLEIFLINKSKDLSIASKNDSTSILSGFLGFGHYKDYADSIVIGLTDQKDTTFQKFQIYIEVNWHYFFGTNPSFKAVVNEPYYYVLQLIPKYDFDAFKIDVSKPDWLNFNESLNVLSGTPSISDTGALNNLINILVHITNSYDSIDIQQRFQINVIDTSRVSININDESKNIVIYPNPASEFIKIESELNIDYIELIDILGNTIQKTYNSMFNIKSFQSGIYFVKIYSNNISIIKKIIKN